MGHPVDVRTVRGSLFMFLCSTSRNIFQSVDMLRTVKRLEVDAARGMVMQMEITSRWRKTVQDRSVRQ